MLKKETIKMPISYIADSLKRVVFIKHCTANIRTTATHNNIKESHSLTAKGKKPETKEYRLYYL